MGSELALSGLASGFDWQPVVEQLIELEAIPKKRLQLEKQQNDEKMSELGLLKGQLDTLKGAAAALQNDDLFEARKGSLDEDAAKFMAANIKAGAMTGSYKIEVSLLGSSTSMSSIRRKPQGLGKALHLSATNFAATGLDISLAGLPLQTAITKGTFTVSSRTYEITNLHETLQELMDRIAADPEDDQTAVTLEYDSINDKMVVDGNELINDPNFTDTPILGSPTDTSNFLKVLRLLDQVSLNRDADYEGNSGISIWSGSSANLTNPEKAAWLRQDDEDENGGSGLAANDDKIYTANGSPTGKEVLYRRKAVHAQHEDDLAYSTGDVVYRHGYLYEALQNFPTTAWDKTVDAINTTVSLGSLSAAPDDNFWQLKKNLLTDRVGNSTGQATFSAAADTGGGAGQYHIPTASTAAGATGLGDAYKAGDIVKAADGSYFRAVQDRQLANLTSTEDFGNIVQALVTSKDANAGGWTTVPGVAGAPDEFRPNHIFVKGRIYEANTSGGATQFGSSNGFAEHDGVTGQVNFSGNDLVVGNAADNSVNKKFFRAEATWNGVDSLPSTATAHPTLWTAGQFVQADDDNFYEAHADWANVTTHSTTKNYDPAVANLKYVHTTAASTNFYEAHADWTNVTDFANGGSVDNTYATNKFVFHAGQNKFYKAQQDFKDIAAKAERTIYNAAGTMAQKFAKNGTGASTNFYKAKAAWANVSAYTENTAVAGINTNDYRQLSTNVAAGAGGADGRIYKALQNLSLIAAHDAKVNYKPSETLDKQIVVNGGNYFQAAVDRAKEEFNAAGAGLTSSQVGGMGLNQRALDTVAGKTFAAKDNLALIQAHDAKVNYEPALGLGSEVVENGGQFYKFTHGDGKLAKHAYGAGGLSATNAMAMAVGERALDNVAGKAFSAKALLGTINSHAATTNYAQNALIESGGDFFKAKLTNLAEATFTLPAGISDLSIVDNGDHLIDTGNGRVFSAQMALKDTINHQADASYDPSSGALNDKLRTVGGLAGAFYKPSQVINFNNFSAASSYATSTSIVKDGGQYYQFSDVYAGSGGVATANPGEWVKSPTDGNFYKNTSAGALSTDPVIVPAGWTSSTGGQSTLAGMVAQGEMATNVTTFATDPSAGGNTLWTDVTNDVKKPTGSNVYWTQETNATTPGANQPAGNAYWEKITTDVTKPVFGVANDFWTDEPLATTLGNNAFWTEVTNDVIKPGATTDFWTDVTAAVANFGDAAYWTNVTTAVTLNTQDASAGDTAYWEDVTSDIVTFPGGGTLTGGSIQDEFWEYVPEIAIATPLGAGVNDGYWQEVSSTLTDLTNASWWTDASGTLKDKSQAAWWTDKTSTLNDLTDTNWWSEVTAELKDPADAGFTNWWTEIAHANGESDFDSLYWQQIKPGMKRVANNAVVANAVDHSIWSQVGNLQSSAGNDGTFGLHDTNEAAMRPTQGVQTYAGGTTYSPGTILEATDSVSGVTNYYKARVVSTNKDPANANLNANEWELLGPKSSMTEDQAYGFTFTDPDFWKQNDTPTPGVTAGWENYWETLSETVLTSSQTLGSVSLTEKIANANFDGFSGGNFSATGDVFYIGDGTGAVRIDYNVNDDTVADLIQRVNDSDANVTMYYDPVGDKLVVQNNADGAIGITLHERPLEVATTAQPDGVWDSLTANQATGNILELMGLATPIAEADYTAYNSAATYTKGTYVKETTGLTTTYWQALDDVAAGGSLDRSNPKWEQVARGVARAASSELGNNFAITINDGETIYNNTASFDETVHGYEGITFDVSGGAVGDAGTVKIERDSNPARNAIGKFVEEFNDAQDYVRSLVAVNQDGDNITAGTFSSNIEISRLGSQLRKIVFGDSYVHSESKIAQDGTDLTVSTHALLTSVQADLGLGASDAGYQVKVKADESIGAHTIGDTTYQEWNGSAWVVYSPQFSSFRLADIGLDFGTGSDRLQMKDSSKLTAELLNNPDKVQALFAEATATADDKNTGTTNKQYQGVTFDLNDFLSNFLSGDSDSGYKGTYQAHAESIRAQNKRIDERIEDLERYLEQRESALTQGFIRMEEMQSKISTQMQTLTNSFANNKK
ncbi:flagellar filament capping protein FliD [Opitutales bacterium]|jgi:flagellar capping protein FliD|nr:flagellar filament capping protein FliD [Opitutales bacterium]